MASVKLREAVSASTLSVLLLVSDLGSKHPHPRRLASV